MSKKEQKEPTREELKAEIADLKDANKSKWVALGGLSLALLFSLAVSLEKDSETVRLNQGKVTQEMETSELVSKFVEAINPQLEKNGVEATLELKENGETKAEYALGNASLGTGGPSN